MAAVDLCLNFTEVTLAVGSYVTAAALKAPTNQMLRITGIKLASNGIAGDAKPLDFRLARITAATGTGTSETPRKLNNALTVTPQATGRIAFTVEPTNSGVFLLQDKYHPQGGIVNNREFRPVIVAEATEIALQIQIPTGGTVVQVSGHIEFEE